MKFTLSAEIELWIVGERGRTGAKNSFLLRDAPRAPEATQRQTMSAGGRAADSLLTGTPRLSMNEGCR
jgi:hypothetical protein